MSRLSTGLLLAAIGLWAQTGSGQGRIQGYVADPSGKTIAAAGVIVRSADTGFVRSLTTDEGGNFTATALPVGVYQLDAMAPGFSTKRITGLDVHVGETRTAAITLEVSASASRIEVQSSPQVVNTDDTHNSVSINERAIRDLPIRGRNFVEFVQLTPHVTQEQNRYGIVVNGQRSINSNISVDGVDFNDSLQGGQRGGGPNESAYFFPQLAVREFQVVASGVSAEVGRTNAGYVNVVTRSGTSDLHGEGFFSNRNGAMTAKDAFGNDSSSNSQNQFGVAAGGAIKKDKLFFFSALEKNLVTIPYTVKFNIPTGNIALPAEIASQQGNFDQKNNPLVAFGKLDYLLNSAHTLNVQYTYAAQYGLNFGGVSGQTTAASTNNTVLDRASQGVKGALTSVVSPNMLNELRAQYAYDNRQQKPNSTLAEVTINDLGTLGGSKNGTYIYEATRAEVMDNLTWMRGRHTVKTGFDLNFSPQRQQRETNYGAVYTFRTLSDYLAAVAGDRTKINRYQQSIAANGTQGLYEAMQQDHAVFVSDSFKVRRDLTINAGLRWDLQINPQPPTPNPAYPVLTGKIPNDLKAVQPRIGLAWNIGGKDRTVIRISGGIYSARTPGYLMQRVFTDNGLNTLVLDSGTDPSILQYLKVPEPIRALPAGVKTPINSIYAFDPAFHNPRSGQMSAAIEQKLSGQTKITVSFTRNSTWGLQRRIDRNLYPSTTLSNGLPVYPTFDSTGRLAAATGFDAATGLPIFTDSLGRTIAYSAARVARPDSALGQINVNSSIAHSSYNGLGFTLQHRMSRRLQFAANYTHATSRDDDSNERDFNRQNGLDTYNFKRDAAYAKNDIRHNGNFNALYDLGRGFTVSTLLFARTGIPVKPVIGTDTQNDGNTVNDRPVINGQVAARDAFRQPGLFDWDMRVLKRFAVSDRMQISFSAEVYNITRSSNKTFNGDGETTFGAPTATRNANTGFNFANNSAFVPTFAPGTDRFGGPRQAQLGVRVVF